MQQTRKIANISEWPLDHTEYVAKTIRNKGYYEKFTVWRQTAIKNSVSNDLRSTFVDSIIIFDCHLCEVFIEYRPTEYIAIAIRNKGY